MTGSASCAGARPVLTDAVYARQKHPFMSPPATIQQKGGLYAFLQDTLRGAALDGPGIYDRAKVTALLDEVPSMDTATRTRTDTLLMWMASLCLLSERMGLSATRRAHPFGRLIRTCLADGQLSGCRRPRTVGWSPNRSASSVNGAVVNPRGPFDQSAERTAGRAGWTRTETETSRRRLTMRLW